MSRKVWLIIVAVVLSAAVVVGGTIWFITTNEKANDPGSVEGQGFKALIPEDFGIAGQLEIEAYTPVVLEDGQDPTRLPISIVMTTASKIHGEDEHSFMSMTMVLLGQKFVNKSESFVVSGDPSWTYVQTNEQSDDSYGPWRVVGGRRCLIDYSVLFDQSVLDITRRKAVENGFEIVADSKKFIDELGLESLFNSMMGDLADADGSAFADAAKSAYVVYYSDKNGNVEHIELRDFNYVSNQLTANLTWKFDVAPLDYLNDIYPSEDIVSSAVVSDGEDLYGVMEGQGYNPEGYVPQNSEETESEPESDVKISESND